MGRRNLRVYLQRKRALGDWANQKFEPIFFKDRFGCRRAKESDIMVASAFAVVAATG
jgi:hypothetical protein